MTQLRERHGHRLEDGRVFMPIRQRFREFPRTRTVPHLVVGGRSQHARQRVWKCALIGMDAHGNNQTVTSLRVAPEPHERHRETEVCG